MLRRGLLSLMVAGALLALTSSAMAAGLTIDSVLAVEYDNGVFAAAVLAHGPEPLMDAQVEVNWNAVEPDRASQLILSETKNLTLFKFVKVGPDPVIQPGDTVTAVVTDMAGTTVEKSVFCVQGRFLRQLVVCR